MIDDIEIELCYNIDAELYFPVKQELSKVNVTYSLGHRKEDFKSLLSQKLKLLRQEVNKK